MKVGSSLPTIKRFTIQQGSCWKKFILKEFPLLPRFPEDRQNVQKSFVFFIKPRSTNLESKQKTGNKQHEVFPYKEREQSSANKLNVKL